MLTSQGTCWLRLETVLDSGTGRISCATFDGIMDEDAGGHREAGGITSLKVDVMIVFHTYGARSWKSQRLRGKRRQLPAVARNCERGDAFEFQRRVHRELR